jgi:hypothetical protein
LNSQNISDEIKSLTYTFVKALIETTGGELSVSVKFVDTYNDACRTRFGNNNRCEENFELRQHVRDNLLGSGYIFVDPSDVDLIYLTQKAIDECSEY